MQSAARVENTYRPPFFSPRVFLLKIWKLYSRLLQYGFDEKCVTQAVLFLLLCLKQLTENNFCSVEDAAPVYLSVEQEVASPSCRGDRLYVGLSSPSGAAMRLLHRVNIPFQHLRRSWEKHETTRLRLIGF